MIDIKQSNLNMISQPPYYNYQYQSHETDQPTVAHNNRFEVNSNFNSLPNKPKKPEEHVRNQFERQLQNYRAQIDSLKEQVMLDEEQKQLLEQTIKKLKQDLVEASRENQKMFQENQKNKHLMEKLKIDNQSMTMEIDRFRTERNSYYDKIKNIERLKHDISVEVHQKNQNLQESKAKIRKLQRINSDFMENIRQFQQTIKINEKEIKQLREQLKTNLQKYLHQNDLVSKIENQLQQTSTQNHNLMAKINELQRERQELMIKIGYEDSQNRSSSNSSRFMNQKQKSMIEIQGYMKEISNVIEEKIEDREKYFKNYEKFCMAIECLEQNLS